jgi:hypothetical protein
MRLSWFRLLPLFFAACWLPVQAIAAIAMPYCRHGEAQRAPQAAVAGHCAEHGAAAGAEHGMACDDCGLCHLAGACFMPAVDRTGATLPASQVFSAWVAPAPSSTVPEPPQHPPKRST